MNRRSFIRVAAASPMVVPILIRTVGSDPLYLARLREISLRIMNAETLVRWRERGDYFVAYRRWSPWN